MPHPEIGDGIDKKSPASDRKRRPESLNYVTYLLDSSSVFVENLRQMGFARFLAPLNEQILELAVQPDSCGERSRARLISYVFAGLRGIPAESATVEEIVQVSNVVVPCFLLAAGTAKTAYRDQISRQSLRFWRTL